MATEDPVLSPLVMDRGIPLGNSIGDSGRRALHVKIDSPISTTSGPIEFVLDGSPQQVTEDTAVPSNSIPLPVKVLNQDPIEVTGTFMTTNSANGDTGSPVPTQATQVAGSDGTNLIALKVSSTGVVSVDGSAVTQPVSGSLGRTWDLDFVTDQVDVSGSSVAISNFPASQNVVVTASALPANAAQETGGHLESIDSKLDSPIAVTGPLTDTELRASPVEVSGTVTALQGTSPWLTSRSWVLSSGTDSVAAVQSGTWTVQQGTPPWSVSQSGVWTTGRTWDLNFATDQVDASGSSVSVSSSALPIGAATEAKQDVGNASLSSIDGKLNSLGQKTMDNSVPVVIASDQSAVPVSQSGTWTTGRTWSLSSGSDSVTSVQGTSPWVTNVSQFGGSNVVTGTGTSGSGIPRVTVSSDSSITANAGTNLNTSALSLEATQSAFKSANHTDLVAINTAQSDGTQKTKIVDGSNATVGPVQTLSGTNYLPVVLASSATPGAAVVARSIQVAGSDGTNAQTLNVDTTGKLNINNISGTVSLPTGASTSANQTNGNQKSQQVDGSGNVQPAGDIVSRPVFVKPGDGTNSITVKAASTAAIAADTSQVVALSPNTPLPTGTNSIGAVTQATASNFNAQVVGNVASAATDSGNPVKVGGVFNTTAPTFTNGQRGDLQISSHGAMLVAGKSATGVAPTDNPVSISGTDPGGLKQSIRTTTNGETVVSPVDGYKATYSASIVGLVAANTPTDIFTIYGSGTKTIRVLKISFSGSQNTSGARDVLLLKRSTANTGGTSTNPTKVAFDSNNAAATATVTAYTANPTLGTLVGQVAANRIQLLATNVTNPNQGVIWDFSTGPSQAQVLRGTGEGLAINLNSVTSGTNNLAIYVTWTEE